MRKLRIVQIESFYGPFLDGFYAARPGLAQQPFAVQTQRLLDSGYSGGHNVVPYLDPSRWDAHYLIPNNDAAQQRWLHDSGETGGGDIGRTEVLTRQLEAIAPDVIYLSDIPVFDFSTLGRLRRRPLIVGWHATYVDPRLAWSQIDLVLSGIGRLRERTLALGARAAAHYMPAAPAYRRVGGDGGARARPADIVFSGSFYGGIHQARALQYRELSRRLDGRTLEIHTRGGFPTEPGERIAFFPAVYGSEVLDLYARSRIVLDARGEFGLGDGAAAAGQPSRESSNMRIFEATRAGALLLTEDSSNLPECFEIGREIETFGSTDELIDKARFYGADAHQAQRRAIAAAGHARVMREHLIEHRALRFEQLLEQHFDLSSLRASAVAVAPTPAPSPRAEGRQLIVTSVGANSLLFGLACIDTLSREQPDAWVHVHCEDAATRALLDGCRLPVTPVGDDELRAAQAGWGWHADAGTAAAPGARALGLVRLLAERHPNAARVSFVDASLDLAGSRALPPAGDGAVRLLDLGFGANEAHAAQALGRCSLALLSVPVGDATAALLRGAVQPGGDEPGRLAERVVASAAAAGLAVEPVVAATPWQGADDAERPFLFFVLRLRGLSTWEFLTFGDGAAWAACYRRRYVPYLQRVGALLPRLAQQPAPLGDQQTPLTDSPLARYFFDRDRLAKAGYRLMTGDEYAGFRNATLGWDTMEVARIQHAAFQQLIGQYREGRQRQDLRALASVLKRVLEPGMRLLETGCGSGYNHEFIEQAVLADVQYTGIDLAPAMVAMARDVYPKARFEVMGSEALLGFADGSQDVVLNGASLMHTVGFERALQEARRVARHHVVLHTVTVHDGPGHLYFEKNAYGSKVVEVVFSAHELDRLLRRNGLLPVLMEDSIGYDLQQVVGVPTRSLTIACFCEPASQPQPQHGAVPVARNHYCTYFDANYLPRGVLMMESVRRHDPHAWFFVLCLDDVSERVVRETVPQATPFHVGALMAADPGFAECRSNRSQIEWYFTATSVFVNHLLASHPDVPRISYLDADLFFYSSPEVLLHEAAGASAQIIEHRFAPGQERLVVYGRFNVGWIGFFNTPEGRQVVADYRADCIEWCYDRVEPERFGDQKYLDRWPARYPHCCVSQLNGANVGPWNLGRWKSLRRLGADDWFIDADRLVFFHFSGLKRLGFGDYATKEAPAAYGMYYETLYAPYLKALGDVERRLAPLTEDVVLKDIRYDSW